MTQQMDPNTMLRLMRDYARQRGIPKPTTPEGWQALTAAFLRDVQARAQQVIGAAGDATYSSDPIARMDPPQHLLRDSGGMLDIADVQTTDDDFAELERSKARAMEQAGGDDLAAAVIYRQGEHAALQEQAKFTRAAPPSVLRAVLGTARTVKSGDPVVECARWTADNDAETCAVACAFTATPSGFASPSAASDFRPYGVVQWGTQGNLARAEVDLIGDGNGAQFMVSGSQVILSVGIDPQFPLLPDPTQLTLAGMISFGTLFRQPPLTRTQYVDTSTAAGADTGFLEIKPWARRVWVFRTDAAQSIDIQFQNAGVGAVYTVSVAANTNMTEPVPISGDVTHLKIKNTGAGAISAMRIIYEIGI